MSQILQGNLQLLTTEVYIDELIKFYQPLHRNFSLKYAETIEETMLIKMKSCGA